MKQSQRRLFILFPLFSLIAALVLVNLISQNTTNTPAVTAVLAPSTSASARESTSEFPQIAPAIPGTPATMMPATATALFTPVGEIRLIGPPENGRFLATSSISFLWEWDEPLAENQAFALILRYGDDELLLGKIDQPNLGRNYRLTAVLPSLGPGETAVTAEWQIRLINNLTDEVYLFSPIRQLILLVGS